MKKTKAELFLERCERIGIRGGRVIVAFGWLGGMFANNEKAKFIADKFWTWVLSL